MNCLLTGGTGILGSHIIFEWLYKAIVENTVDTLYVVIRDAQKTAKERLIEILDSPSRPLFLDNFTLDQCLDKLVVISQDLSSFTAKDIEEYQLSTIIHCAGSTNLQNNSDVKNQVHAQNYLVTGQILNNLPKSIDRFIYISTAYSFGIQNEKVDDEIEGYSTQEFRNPYEESKRACEKLVKLKCENAGIDSLILRPSIICGRLINPPFFETPKFDVFYSLPIFLQRYAEKSVDNFRIWIDQKSGLNIVPVDFVAKSILYVFLHPNIKELNIVNPKPILHRVYVGQVLASFGIKNYEYVSEKPQELNSFEQLYYKTIGSVFEKYISIPDLKYKNHLIKQVIKDLNMPLDLGVHENFMNLIDFSVAKQFKESY